MDAREMPVEIEPERRERGTVNENDTTLGTPCAKCASVLSGFKGSLRAFSPSASVSNLS